ncbi:MAG: excinuclease ABC subunit UvrB [bacterium]|nr:excinuclease ABC subunit UvrB [bacterium]
MSIFNLHAPFPPQGDQPQAIEQLVASVEAGHKFTTLLGATGTGKTFTMASAIARIGRPALVLSPNKTLAAQLASEFRDFFADNAVEYFVSYFDYYQPEAYIPQSDTYIAKDSSLNEEVDRLRHAATQAVLERRDALVVASVSCIYGLGNPEDYRNALLVFRPGDTIERDFMLRRLVDMFFTRTTMSLDYGTFRLQGDVLEIQPIDRAIIYRIEFFDEEVERMSEIDPVSGEVLGFPTRIVIYPAKHYVTPPDKMRRALESINAELEEQLRFFNDHGKLLEAERLEMRTKQDVDMLENLGYCNGIENYSRHLTGREKGQPPYTLIDYFPKDLIVFIDESHVAVPQLHGMLAGDKARKNVLIEFGFRLPSALDNRPLSFDEFIERAPQIVFISATPGPFELEHSPVVVEQIIRPTGLLDPAVEVRPVDGQIDDLLHEVRIRAERQERVLVTTLTKRMAEDLTDYFKEMGVRVRYLHSDIDTLGRIQILRDLRLGEFDVLVGINLLREGLDLPEVSLVAILDASKEGFLRSRTSLVQTIGRAARNVDGTVILYADTITDAMREAMEETERRRSIQKAYNEKHGIVPRTVRKAVNDILDMVGGGNNELNSARPSEVQDSLTLEELRASIDRVQGAMLEAAKTMQFELAAALRDEMYGLEKELNRRLEGIPVAARLEMAETAGMPLPGQRGRRMPKLPEGDEITLKDTGLAPKKASAPKKRITPRNMRKRR